jgi:Arm domain-containing DNA-binding protein
MGLQKERRMARGIERLSPLFVQRVKKPGLHGDGAGLWLQVSVVGENGTDKPRIAKSWVYRFMLNRRARSMGLGPFYDVSLGEARELARAARKLVRSGVDPIDARKTQKVARVLEAAKSITFKKAAEDYIELHRASWTNAISAKHPIALARRRRPIPIA